MGRRQSGGGVVTARKGSGSRALKVRVKSKGRKLSSKLWLERQLNDPYVARAKREGFRSRAAYKLIEIDDKARVLKKGMRVIDLGAAPGGWSQVAARRVGAQGRVVAIDVLPMDAIAGVDFAQLDFLERRCAGEIAGFARRAGRRGVVRHGGERHRPRQDRSPEDHGAGGSGRRFCPRSAGAGRHVSSPRCCKAAPKPRCSPPSSATLKA